MYKMISPLRYPGGKAKLTPLIKYIIQNKTDSTITTYIEPFAGGASVALELLLTGVVSDIIINDYDKAIYSFWRALITETDRFIETIRKTPVTMEEWKRQKEIYTTKGKKYSFDLGFATFFLNRTNRSGIITAGPIGGQKQNSDYHIDVRFNKEKLIKRIRKIAQYRDHIKIYNKDIRNFIRLVLVKNQINSFVYFDPPYHKKGQEVYNNHLEKEDHIEICDLITQTVSCPWIMTYDNEEIIASIYRSYTQRLFDLRYSLANKCKSSELMIFSNPFLCPTNHELSQVEINMKLSEDIFIDN